MNQTSTTSSSIAPSSATAAPLQAAPSLPPQKQPPLRLSTIQSGTPESAMDQQQQLNIAKMFISYFYRVSQMSEQSWLSIGRLALGLLEPERAKMSFEQALKNNPHSVPAVQNLANFYKQRENFPGAIDFYQKLINMDSHNSDAWSSLAFCYLMQDDVQKAFTAYQQALYFAPNSRDPYLWYGLGILYERHGSDDQAEEFFVSALRCDPSFERSSEIFYRLGVIFKNKKTYDKSIDCFQYILKKPPRPLSEHEIRFQLGILYELQGDFNTAREIFGSILNENPRHIRTVQYCAWNEFNSGNLEAAINRISVCIEIDPNDPISWYILGRCHVTQRNFSKSYEAYQQAVLRNGKSPVFWCSIGLLYFQIQQYRDALDAFSKAIHLNSNLWEVWWNLGILYETCNNQISDAIDSYKRALEVDPSNALVHQRLSILKNYQQQQGASLPSIPSPLDLPFSIHVPPPWQLFSKRNPSSKAPPSGASSSPYAQPAGHSAGSGGSSQSKPAGYATGNRAIGHPPSGGSASSLPSQYLSSAPHQRRPTNPNTFNSYSQPRAVSVSGPSPSGSVRFNNYPVQETKGQQQPAPSYYYQPPAGSAEDDDDAAMAEGSAPSK